MPVEFKRVPAIDKCFAILDLFAKSKGPLGISEISRQLGLNKSTVFNTVHTLTDLDVLENGPDGKFGFGVHLYTLGNTAGNRSELIKTVHPYLEKINGETKLSAFLGIRSDHRAIILDKVDTAYDIKISSEVGMRLPLLAGAGGKALLSLFSEKEIDKTLSSHKLKKFTPNSNVNKTAYKREVLRVRREGIALDMEEYIEGIIAFATPLKTHRKDLHAAIWAVGLKRQVSKDVVPKFSRYLKEIGDEINERFSMSAGPFVVDKALK